jgi:hypothetical protein
VCKHSFAQTGDFVLVCYRTLLPEWQKESWIFFEETSGYVRPERVNKWRNSMKEMMMMMMTLLYIILTFSDSYITDQKKFSFLVM